MSGPFPAGTGGVALPPVGDRWTIGAGATTVFSGPAPALDRSRPPDVFSTGGFSTGGFSTSGFFTGAMGSEPASRSGPDAGRAGPAAVPEGFCAAVRPGSGGREVGGFPELRRGVTGRLSRGPK
ncbi:MAG TPA: hypothetical protein VN408_15845 [Actinoplanes sp.]|nr:hypothetical protein [Actinoplanes sp.]